MEWPKDLNFKPLTILKIGGVVLAAIVVLAISFRLIGSSVRSILPSTSNGVAYQKAMYSESVSYDSATGGVATGLSVRNVAPTPSNLLTTGDQAEAFEVTEYNAYLETRHLKDTCEQIVQLKTRPEVVFETANNYEKGCDFSFKVKKEQVPDVLKIIKDLDPRELNQNVYTIQRLVDDYTSEQEILQKKLKSIDDTLNSATLAYDNLTHLATNAQDVASLAKIIDSKLNLIERLTQERLNINSQLERLNRAKAEQLDRLDYVYFRVNVSESKFVDWRTLADSWKMQVQSFVSEVNGVLEDVSINLLALLFYVVQYLVYFFIALIIVKYVWRLAKYLWKK